MLLFQLLHAPVGSRLVRTDFDGDTLTLGIATTNPNASCPACGGESWRVHSRYTLASPRNRPSDAESGSG